MKQVQIKGNTVTFSNPEQAKKLQHQARLSDLAADKTKGNLTQAQKIDIILAQQEIILEQQVEILQRLAQQT